MLILSQEGGPTTTLLLTKEQGQELKELIERNIDCRITSYCHKIGIEYSNLANILGGRKKISFRTLQRLVSDAPFDVECQVQFLIKPTKDAPDADYQSLEDILFLEELDDATGEQ